MLSKSFVPYLLRFWTFFLSLNRVTMNCNPSHYALGWQIPRLIDDPSTLKHIRNHQPILAIVNGVRSFSADSPTQSLICAGGPDCQCRSRLPSIRFFLPSPARTRPDQADRRITRLKLSVIPVAYVDPFPVVP